MDDSDVQEVDTSVAHCQNTATQIIVTSPIMDMCMATARSPGARV